MLNKELLDILACPVCKGDLILIQKDKEEFLKCENCKLLYPIKEDIPILLEDEAIK
jgi:uncharacterized protein YbaR (Trm112 family)